MYGGQYFMKNRFLKRAQLMIANVLLIASISGCGAKEDITNTKITEGQEKITADMDYPLDTDEKLTYWGGLNSAVASHFSNLGETEIGKMWQKNTGVSIEFLHPAAGQETEQFNLLLADGQYPDLWHANWTNATTYPGGPEKAIEDGIILDLTDLIEQYCPNLKEYLKEHPDIDKEIKTDSGKYYCFPSIREIEEGCTTRGPIIRKDLLDQLGLGIPETVDEWYDVLTAFKENGIEIPVSWYYPDKTRTFAYAWGAPESFVLDDGKCVYGPSKPEYKDYLKTMRKWYEEGLLNPDMFSGGEDLTLTMLTSGKIGATFGYAGGTLQAALSNAQADDSNYELAACKWPVLNKGEKPKYGYRDNRFYDGGVAIGGTCKNPALAAKVLDYGYGEEGNLMFNFGKEGESYTIQDGKPVYTELITNNPEGWTVAEAMGKYIMASYDGPFIQSGEYQMQYFTKEEAKNAVYTWADCDSRETTLPTILPTQDESTEYASIYNELKTYVEEMTTKFINGTADIDKEYDNYLKTLNQLGLARATEIENAALDRYKQR